MRTIYTIILITILITGCSEPVTKSDILRAHSVDFHVNGSQKLTDSEGDLIGVSGHAFMSYQKLRHDPRSYIVNNLTQSGERVNYLVGNGFFLIDKTYLNRVNRSDLTRTLAKITNNNNKRLEYIRG